MMILHILAPAIAFSMALIKAIAFSDALIDFRMDEKEHNRNKWFCCQDNPLHCRTRNSRFIMRSKLAELIALVLLFLITFIFIVEPLI